MSTSAIHLHELCKTYLVPERVTMWSLINLRTNIGVLVAALVRLGEKAGSWQAAGFAGMLLAGMVIVYRFWLILAMLSFWSVCVENLLEAAAASAVLFTLARLIRRLRLRRYSGTSA